MSRSRIRRLKDQLKEALERRGLYAYSHASLPRGVNPYEDLKRLPNPPVIKTAFDVGANVGQTCFEMTAAFPGARIYAFEPIETTFARLVTNTKHLPRVQCHRLALGAEQGSSLVSTQEDSVYNSLNHSEPNDTQSGSKSALQAVQIETAIRFCQQHDVASVDLLKTDTEGYDLKVLQGADALLSAGKVRAVLAEVTFSEGNVQNTPFIPVFDFLTARGFHLLGLYETLFLQIKPSSTGFATHSSFTTETDC